MKVVLQSLISVIFCFLISHTSMVFCPCLFKDITLCKSFVICLVCSVTFQKLRLYEYSGKMRYSDSDLLLCIFVVCCMSGEFGIDLLVLDTVHCTRLSVTSQISSFMLLCSPLSLCFDRLVNCRL